MAKLADKQCDAAGKTFSAILRKMPNGDSEKLQAFIEGRKTDRFRQLTLDEFTPVEEPVPVQKFAELADLGFVTVSADYVHGTRLDSFKAQHEKKFRWGYNSNITDANYPNPSRILKTGDKLRVKAYRPIVSGTTTSEERMAFLATQGKPVYTGAQGATIVWEQKRTKLPKGYWYASFDQKEKLWRDSVGYHGVPCVDAYSGGAFRFVLGLFERVWVDDVAFFGFCDE